MDLFVGWVRGEAWAGGLAVTPPGWFEGLTFVRSILYAFQMGSAKQLELALPRRGGKRPGAGRPRTRPHPGLIGPGVAHVKRKEFASRNPLHVTQRMVPAVGNLRTSARLGVIKQALHDASRHLGMQVVHFSVQGNHLHLVVEAGSARELSREMKGLAVRVAVRLNQLAKRRGTVFADRYHARVLESPRAVANALRYVFENYRHHARETLHWSWRDPFSSSVESPLREPGVWLLRVGWKLGGSPAVRTAG